MGMKLRRFAWMGSLAFCVGSCAGTAQEAVMQPAGMAAYADSGTVNELLQQATVRARRLKGDASELYSFSGSGRLWTAYAEQVNAVREDVNAVARTSAELAGQYDQSAPWQKLAILRIGPMLSEMGASTVHVIEQLNQERGRFLTSPGNRQLLKENEVLAANLSAVIDEYADYGRTRERMVALREKLEAGHR